MSGEPRHKGVGLIAVVKGIQANPRARARVPPNLAHYLEQSILISGWYPERDYHALITLLASTVDAKQVGGDVWAFFGRTAAQRDVAGDQAAVPARSRLDKVGVYRNFLDIDGNDVPGLFLRITKMWSLYHDSGQHVYGRHRDKHDVVVMRLSDFVFPVRGLADLQTAYMMEYARLSGYALEGSLTRYSPDGATGYEWQYRVPDDAEKLRSMERLPILP